MRPAVEHAAGFFLRTPPHCLKKKGTLAAWHWSRTDRTQSGSSGRAFGPALAPEDDPADAGQVKRPKVLEQGLDREHPQAGRRGPQVLDSRQAVLRFSTLTPNQMCGSRAAKPKRELSRSRIRSDRLVSTWNVCQLARLHDPADLLDVVVGHSLVEQVAHRVDENHLGLRPPQRLGKLLGDELEVEPLLVRMPRHAPEPLGERLGVTMRTPGTDLRAAPDRVPGGVGPFDLGVQAHRELPVASGQLSVASCQREE